MVIRDATPWDAPAACLVLRRSIAELCVADHGDEPSAVAAWLANKTPECFAALIVQPQNSLLVVAEGSDILAVGAVTDAGRITLNYVSPDARFRGISSALLVALEARAAERGATRSTLVSTETALRFYESRGFRRDGLPDRAHSKASGYPMSKRLR
jgi:GNAT superfamily N-acetyltransferase